VAVSFIGGGNQRTKTRKQVLIALPVSGLLCNIVKNIIIDAETACSMI
jgi:hypothetical protein